MVAEMLSQEEINALLGNVGNEDEDSAFEENISEQSGESEFPLTPEEVDTLGEIGNICMGTAATTLFTLLNHKVMITTPKVESLTWEEFTNTITDDLTAVSVDYTEGFLGSNLMILKNDDVKVITDLIMGGEGEKVEGPITELHLSAISESMNQMIGSSSTSMAQIFNKKIDISPPQAIKIETDLDKIFEEKGNIVKISFRLQVEKNIIDSELMQVLPIKFAKGLISELLNQDKNAQEIAQETASEQEAVYEPATVPEINDTEPKRQIFNEPLERTENMYTEPSMMKSDSQTYYEEQYATTAPVRNVDIQKPKFESFNKRQMAYPKENMDLLMDVSLEVSAELGRTSRKIKEILEFGPGSIIELNCLVGEPIDVLVNGKFVAKGEVVVIDENFGIRVTDIINPEDRI